MIKEKIAIRKSPGRGRGVFALQNIKAGALIECCPALVFGPQKWENVEKGPIGPYVFAWNKGGALLLGSMSMVNHSQTPNAEVVLDIKSGSAKLFATQDIPKNTELTINYGRSYEQSWLGDKLR